MAKTKLERTNLVDELLDQVRYIMEDCDDRKEQIEALQNSTLDLYRNKIIDHGELVARMAVLNSLQSEYCGA